MKMLPWVKEAWSGLTDNEQASLKEQSIKIVNHICNPTSVKAALNIISPLMEKFPFLVSDVYPAYESLKNMEFNVVGYSDMNCLNQYFQQFAKATLRVQPEPKVVSEPTTKKIEFVKAPENSLCKVGSKLLVHNDAYGDITVEVIAITATAYVVRYVKNRKLLIGKWRISKDSPRILQYSVE